MKKILVLFVLAFGLMSFTKSDFETNNSLCVDIYQNDETNLNKPSTVSIEDELYTCTATVTYYGMPYITLVGYGTSMNDACAQAYNSATLWISAYG